MARRRTAAPLARVPGTPGDPGAGLAVPATWRDLLEELAPAFKRRSARALFTALACGMVLASRRTVVAMAAAAGMAARFRRACWFFSHAVWDADDLGVAMARLIVKYLLAGSEPVTVTAGGTFFRRWGKKVAQARWAYDGSAQGGKKIAFGNTWVIAAIVVKLPACSSPVALPVLFRLWRGKGTAWQVNLAAQMLTTLTAVFPGRMIHGAGDAAFHGQALICQNSTWTTRLPASAVLYGPRPAPTGKLGLVRDPGSGKPYALALFTLDPAATAATVIERYSWRWPIEPSNAAGKQILGVGQACNRLEAAVERTVPFGFLVQSLLICWCARSGYDPADIGRRRLLCSDWT